MINEWMKEKSKDEQHWIQMLFSFKAFKFKLLSTECVMPN